MDLWSAEEAETNFGVVLWALGRQYDLNGQTASQPLSSSFQYMQLAEGDSIQSTTSCRSVGCRNLLQSLSIELLPV